MQSVRIEPIPYGGPLYEAALALRQTHLLKDMGLVLSAETLAAEKEDIHFVALAQNSVMGTVFLHHREPGIIQVRQMVVHPSLRGAGVGRQLMEAAEAFCRRDKTIRQIMMHARLPAVPFYEKCGFRRGADLPTDLKIPICLMTKDLV